MDKELAEFRLDDGTAVLVEVDPPKKGSSIQRAAAVDTGQMVIKAQKTLDESLDTIKPIAAKVLSRLNEGLTTPADEVEVTFGLKLNAEAGVVFGSVGGEVTFEVKLKWLKDKVAQDTDGV